MKRCRNLKIYRLFDWFFFITFFFFYYIFLLLRFPYYLIFSIRVIDYYSFFFINNGLFDRVCIVDKKSINTTQTSSRGNQTENSCNIVGLRELHTCWYNWIEHEPNLIFRKPIEQHNILLNFLIAWVHADIFVNRFAFKQI